MVGARARDRRTSAPGLPAWLAVGAIGVSTIVAAGDAPPPAQAVRSLPAPFIADMPRIDGRLDEPAWAGAAVATDFVQLEPRGGEPATERTEVRLFYNERRLLIGVRLYDREPSRIIGSEYLRDADLAANDTFEVMLDTFHDRRNAFYFATNPAGAQRDALVRNEGDALNWEWDGVWQVACSRDAEGWIAELAIPFSTLRFTPGSAEAWGVNFGRLVARTREHSFWAPLDRNWGFNARWRVSAYGRLDGLDRARRGARLALKPFALGEARQDFEDGDGRLVGDPSLGLDAKLAITPTLVADLSLNTDFAQVESDQQQVNLTRFPLFYPEKREFFLENAGLFQLGERTRLFEPPSTLLFFSRSIGLTEDGDPVPLLGGARVTGKLGRWDLGAFDIVSRETVIGDTRLAAANFAAVRVKRDVLARSSVGALFLSKAPGEEAPSNRVVAADANIAVTGNVSILGLLARSFTPGLTQASHAGVIDVNWETDRGGAFGEYADIGEDFNSEMGFLQRTGIRKYRGAVFLARRPKRLGLRQVFLGEDHTYITDRNGRLQSRVNGLGPGFIFDNGSMLIANWTYDAEGLTEPFEIKDGVEVPVGTYRFNQAVVLYEGDRSRPLAARGMVVAGGFYGGTVRSTTIGGRIRPAARLILELEYSRNAVDLPIPDGRFTTNLAVARLILAFSPRAYLRGLIQADDDDREARANVMFRYTYRPGADLFVVYNEERGIRGATPPVKKRQLLVKITVYATGF